MSMSQTRNCTCARMFPMRNAPYDPNAVPRQKPLYLGGLDVVSYRQGSQLHDPKAATIELELLHLLENLGSVKNKQKFLVCKLVTKGGNTRLVKSIRLRTWNIETLRGTTLKIVETIRRKVNIYVCKRQ